MPPKRYRVPKIARHAAFGHMNGYSLENQSYDPRRAGRGWSATVLTGTGISEPSSLNDRLNVSSLDATIWLRIRLSDLMRSVVQCGDESSRDTERSLGQPR
jgi:hypothetical protein